VTDLVTDRPPAVLVLIVDDQPAFRRAARNVIAVLPGFEVAAEVSTGEASVDMANALGPDLVLMDVHLPGIDGIEASRRILANVRDRAPVIFLLSTDEAVDYSQQVTYCGATAYLSKAEFGPAALRAAWTIASANRRAS
jgi:two-component system, NarL family, invasion response regulator UvrY